MKQQTTNNKQQTTNNKQQTTNNKQQTTILMFVLFAAIFAAFGSGSKLNPYAIAQGTEEIEGINSLVGKGYFKNGRENRHCSAVSIGNGNFITTSNCWEPHSRNHIRDADKTNHNVDVVKRGHEYASGRILATSGHKNYAIVNSSKLTLPAVKISQTNINTGDDVCVVYSKSYKEGSNALISHFNPVRECGKVIRKDNIHHMVKWDKIGRVNGYWGAGVFNSNNELVGIVSYRKKGDNTISGVLGIEEFRDEIQELLN